uniref:Uncharacterized protein n=1 Tax=Pipistrellus kuhlii TaxID=59472 RepID=A0A7J7YY82_PIPKU|nr:hypothetical protein mPipKuh1_009839 [Pipistrellus kuhlii]
MPKRKVSSAKGRPTRSPRGGQPGYQPNLLLQKWKQSPKRQQERINVQTKKCKCEGKGEQRESWQKWLVRNLKKIYLWKREELKTRRVQPQRKQEKKKPSLINIMNHVLSVVPVSLLVQSRGIFLSPIL